MNESNYAQQGWQCPICKRIYSPFTPMCYNCGGEASTSTPFCGSDPTTTGHTLDWMKHDSTTSPNTEIRWTDKVSLDCDGNIRDFNGNILYQLIDRQNDVNT